MLRMRDHGQDATPLIESVISSLEEDSSQQQELDQGSDDFKRVWSCEKDSLTARLRKNVLLDSGGEDSLEVEVS